MPIVIHAIRLSPACRAVIMTAKELNIDLKQMDVDLTSGEHLTEDYLAMNPCHTIPTINDNGFILWESRAIMKYLCNRYAPDSSLYPEEPQLRALVDRWLFFDLILYQIFSSAMIKPIYAGTEVSRSVMNTFTDNLKLLDTLIGDNKYLVGSSLTIADLSVLASTSGYFLFKMDLSAYPNFTQWYSRLQSELSYFNAINAFNEEEVNEFFVKMKTFLAKRMESEDNGI